MAPLKLTEPLEGCPTIENVMLSPSGSDPLNLKVTAEPSEFADVLITVGGLFTFPVIVIVILAILLTLFSESYTLYEKLSTPFVLSLGVPGVVPSKTNETNGKISDLQRCKEENEILYQVKYDMSKDLDNCTNYIQYLSDSKDKAESIQNEFSDYLEETNTKLGNCQIMLDLRSNEVEEHRFYANAYENLYEETNKMEERKPNPMSTSQLLSMVVCTILLIVYVTLVTWVL